MRVGFVIGAAQVGGAERQVQQLARQLPKLGVAVVVLILERPRRRPARSRLPLDGIVHEHLWHSRWLPGIDRRRLLRAVSAHALDLVHFYHVEAIAMATALRSGAGPRLVGSLRGLQFAQDAKAQQSLRHSLPALSAMTTNCEAIRRALVETFPDFDRELLVLPNLITPREPKRDYARDGALRVLFVGSLKSVKNPMLLLEAADRAAGAGLELEVDYVGLGPLEASLRERAARLPANVTVRFLGAMDAADIPYAEHDLLVSSSEREGASNSMLEALASGLPVVASEVGGSVEIVRDSNGGRLFPAGDANALSDLLREFAAHDALRERLGREGAGYVAQRHEPSVVARLHADFYHRQLAAADSAL